MAYNRVFIRTIRAVAITVAGPVTLYTLATLTSELDSRAGGIWTIKFVGTTEAIPFTVTKPIHGSAYGDITGKLTGKRN